MTGYPRPRPRAAHGPALPACPPGKAPSAHTYRCGRERGITVAAPGHVTRNAALTSSNRRVRCAVSAASSPGDPRAVFLPAHPEPEIRADLRLVPLNRAASPVVSLQRRRIGLHRLRHERNDIGMQLTALRETGRTGHRSEAAMRTPASCRRASPPPCLTRGRPPRHEKAPDLSKVRGLSRQMITAGSVAAAPTNPWSDSRPPTHRHPTRSFRTDRWNTRPSR
jgi:hypothetical protein